MDIAIAEMYNRKHTQFATITYNGKLTYLEG